MSGKKTSGGGEPSPPKESQRTPSSRIAVIGTAIGSILGIIGVFIGAFELSSIWGSGTFFSYVYEEHPNLEVFGFLALFILGVALTLIPKFKGRKLFSIKLAWEAIILIVIGNVLVLFTGDKFLPLDDILIVGGILIAFVMVSDVLRKPSGAFALSEDFFWLSLASLLIAACLKTYFDITQLNSSWDSFSFLEISLFSFPAAMIFGIESRTIVFRFARLKKQILVLSFYFGLAGTVLAVTSSIFSQGGFNNILLIVGAVAYLASGICFLSSVEAFKRSSGERLSKMNERDRTRYLYFNRAFQISASWLIFALIIGLIYCALLLFSAEPAQFWIRDVFIHSIAIGFIGSAIAAYAPILLPSVISGRAPYKGLSNIPLYIVTIATIWRVGSDIVVASGVTSGDVFFTGYSGALLIIGMLWFVMMNHRLH